MVHLGAANFAYRQCWGSDGAGHDWDKTQVQNNTIYMEDGYHAMIQCKGKNVPLSQFQAKGEEPGTREISGYPHTNDILTWARTTIGEQWVPRNKLSGVIEVLI